MPSRTARCLSPSAGGSIPARTWTNPPRGGWHWPEWLSELAGTFILVFGGLSAVVFDFGRGAPMAHLVPSHSDRLLVTGAVFAGFGSLVAITPFGRRSGAHLNPAVTLAFWLRGHVHQHDLAGYVLAQCAGACLGAALLRTAWGGAAAPVSFGVTSPGSGVGPVGAVGIEALMTAVLVATILGMVSSTRTARWTPLAVWVVVALLVWKGAPYTGTSLNPARSLGPALVAARWSDYWCYVVGPLGGSALVVGVVSLFSRRTLLTAKLFHDPKYQSTLGTQLPAKPPRK